MTDIADMTDMRFTFKMAIHGHPKNMELPLSALRHQMRRIGWQVVYLREGVKGIEIGKGKRAASSKMRWTLDIEQSHPEIEAIVCMSPTSARTTLHKV